MRATVLSFFFVIASLLAAIPAYADVTIGNGFVCEGSAILKGTQTISYSKAKSNILTTIAKLRQKLQAAAQKKKAGIRQKISAANNAKTLLKACSSGQLADNQVDPIFTQLASGNGTFNGTYSGKVGGFINISGPISMSFVLDGTNFSTLLTIGGNVGTALNAQPLSFTGDVGGIGFPAQFNLPNTFLGSVTLSVTQSGHLSITSPSATFEGDFSSSTITGALNGSYGGFSFTSTATLTR